MAFIGGIIGITLALAVYAGIAALFFYILYRINKAAVKNGILEADEARKNR